MRSRELDEMEVGDRVVTCTDRENHDRGCAEAWIAVRALQEAPPRI